MHRFARSVLSAAVLAAGLSLGLGGCNEEAAHSLIASKDLGGVSFRLSRADSAAFATVADSVRIQASREGYPVHSVSGSLRGTTSLPDLEPGSWRLEIALYDSLHALRWYGDTSVEVRAGVATDALVRLYPAKGSVNVRIVLDSSSRVVWTDTLSVGETNWGNQAAWSAPKVWRTKEGIFLENPPFQCGMLPKVRLASAEMYCSAEVNYCGTALPIPDSSGLVLELEDRRAETSCMAVKYGADQVVRHFVPWTRRGNVTLHMSTESVVLQDPRNSEQEPVDSAFVSYDYSISGFMPRAFRYTLDSNGSASCMTTPVKNGGNDLNPAVLYSRLSADSLAVARSILQSAEVRHPVPLVGTPVPDSNGLAMGCPTDMPFYGRKIRYANGAGADLSWSYSNHCATLPSGWKDLSRVDAMLEALFAE